VRFDLLLEISGSDDSPTVSGYVDYCNGPNKMRFTHGCDDDMRTFLQPRR
jgi:hypothetical protein